MYYSSFRFFFVTPRNRTVIICLSSCFVSSSCHSCSCVSYIHVCKRISGLVCVRLSFTRIFLALLALSYGHFFCLSIRVLGFVVFAHTIDRAMAKKDCAPKAEDQTKAKKKQTEKGAKAKEKRTKKTAMKAKKKVKAKKVKAKKKVNAKKIKKQECPHPSWNFSIAGSTDNCRLVKCTDCNETLLMIREGLPFGDLQSAVLCMYGCRIIPHTSEHVYLSDSSPSDDAGPVEVQVMSPAEKAYSRFS